MITDGEQLITISQFGLRFVLLINGGAALAARLNRSAMAAIGRKRPIGMMILAMFE